MKKLIPILLIAAILFVGCSKQANDSKAETDEVRVITVGTTAPASTDPETSIYYYAGMALKEELEKASGGKMTIDFAMGGVYGSTVQHFAQLKAGTLDVFISGFDVASNLEKGEKFFVAAAPYVFENSEHINQFLASDIFADMNNDIREANALFVNGLLFNQTPRILTANKEIKHPTELQGVKIRVPDSQSQITVWETAGAIPTLVSPSDMYSSLENRIVDAQENDVVASGSFALYEVTPYYMETNYMQQCFLVYMSEKTWEGLSEQQQKWWNEARENACARTTKQWLSKYDSAKQTAIDNGATFVDIDYNEWKAFFTDIVLNKLDGNYWPAGLYKEVQDLYRAK